MKEFTRRSFVGAVPVALLAAHPLWRGVTSAQTLAVGQPLPGTRLIVGRVSPLAAEMPLANLTSWITPNDSFHILTSMATTLPAVDPANWRLTVEGQVERPVTLTYEQLKALPAQTLPVVLECAGNSRNSVSPPLPRSPLNNGYVGNAAWTGVPLRLVLERAGLKPSAQEIVLEGADRGKPTFAPAEVAFAKSIPIDKAIHPDTLLVYEMNGAPLTSEHGGPVRAVVAGWYGTYHVKWLTRAEAIDRPFDGVFMTKVWRVRRPRDGFLREESVSQVAVKSLIVSPAPGARLGIGTHRVMGAAWAGGTDIASVRVSADGGKTWPFARLLEPHGTYAWRLWEYQWHVTAPANYTLMARATDTSGTAQPFAYDLDRNGFEVNQVQSVTVEVT